jgi:hypothetical protein
VYIYINLRIKNICPGAINSFFLNHVRPTSYRVTTSHEYFTSTRKMALQTTSFYLIVRFCDDTKIYTEIFAYVRICAHKQNPGPSKFPYVRKCAHMEMSG